MCLSKEAKVVLKQLYAKSNKKDGLVLVAQIDARNSNEREQIINELKKWGMITNVHSVGQDKIQCRVNSDAQLLIDGENS